MSSDLNGKRNSPLLIPLLGFILILVGIELDIFLPTLSLMKNDLNASDAEVSWLVTANLLGVAFSCFFYGSAADSIGRRPTILFGLLLFFIGSLGCYFAENFWPFVCARFIQGVGCGAPITLSFTIVLDRYEEKASTSLISFLNSLITGATTLAPILGAYLGEFISWRANFALLTFGALSALLISWIFLQETLSLQQKSPWLFKKAFHRYLRLFSSKQIWHIGMIPILMYTALLVYLVNFPLIVSSQLSDIRQIGYLQACVMLSFVLGSLSASYLVLKWEERSILSMAYGLACGGGILLTLASYWLPHLWNILTFFISMISIGIALVIGLYMGKSLNIFPEYRGSSTAFQGALRLITSSLILTISGMAFHHNFTYIAGIMCACIFSSFYLYLKDRLRLTSPMLNHHENNS